MAGLNAGKSFNTWPRMGEGYIPENLIFWDESFGGFLKIVFLFIFFIDSWHTHL